MLEFSRIIKFNGANVYSANKLYVQERLSRHMYVVINSVYSILLFWVEI
jgi:hypothetical protein